MTIPLPVDFQSGVNTEHQNEDIVVRSIEILVQTDPGDKGYWGNSTSYNAGANNPNVYRFRDRALFGIAAEVGTNRFNNSSWWADTYEGGPNWAVSGGAIVARDPKGDFAITGMSCTSDKVGITSPPPTGGVAAFVTVDIASAFGRSSYHDVQVNDVASAKGVGLEVVVKDRWTGSDVVPNPFGQTYRSVGIQFTPGGDPSYGGSPQSPVGAGLYFYHGGYVSATISAIVRASNVVTATFSAATYLHVGDSFVVAGVTDSGFNGTFTVSTVAADFLSVTYAQVAGNASSSGGTAVIADKDPYKFSRGLVFTSESLVGADGTGGSGQRAGVAMHMAPGHMLRWDGDHNSAVGAKILSYVQTSGHDVGLVFRDDAIDLNGPSDTAWATLTSASLALASGVDMNIASNKVVGVRKTGWTPCTGTAQRIGFLTYTAPVISASPTQAEVQSIANIMQGVSRTVKALVDDLHATAGHGLIGT